jgi:carboxylesterase type B
MCINYPVALPMDPTDIKYEQSEDCLSLNVVRPTGTTRKSRLPVLVYIYGGGWQEGGASDGRYNTSYMVQSSVQMGQPTVMVTMNYRLSGWGFLAGDDVRGQGLLNLALRDQRLALAWIQENIEAFGGDRTRVTIQGESVGAHSVGFHMLAYGGRDDGLFQAAVCQSGGPWYMGTYTSAADSEKNYQTLLAATNCTDAHNTVACLRTAPFEVLNTTFAKLPFLAVVDGTLIPEYNSIALAKGNFVKVPLLIGANMDDGKLFAGYGVNSTAEFKTFIETATYLRTTNEQTVDLLLDAYPYPGLNSTHGQSDDTFEPPAPYKAQFARVARYIGDAMFTAGRRYTCEIWAQHGLPCYSYRFNTVPADTNVITLCATHFEEVAFVFNNVIGTGMDSCSFAVTPSPREQRYRQLGQLMSRMWISFAGTHSPNNHHRKQTPNVLFCPVCISPSLILGFAPSEIIQHHLATIHA